MIRTKCTHSDGRYHDCDYVNFRDSLVPLAAAVADLEEPEPPTRDDLRAWAWRWDRAYHRAMAKLVADFSTH